MSPVVVGFKLILNIAVIISDPSVQLLGEKFTDGRNIFRFWIARVVG